MVTLVLLSTKLFGIFALSPFGIVIDVSARLTHKSWKCRTDHEWGSLFFIYPQKRLAFSLRVERVCVSTRIGTPGRGSARDYTFPRVPAGISVDWRTSHLTKVWMASKHSVNQSIHRRPLIFPWRLPSFSQIKSWCHRINKRWLMIIPNWYKAHQFLVYDQKLRRTN